MKLEKSTKEMSLDTIWEEINEDNPCEMKVWNDFLQWAVDHNFRWNDCIYPQEGSNFVTNFLKGREDRESIEIWVVRHKFAIEKKPRLTGVNTISRKDGGITIRVSAHSVCQLRGDGKLHLIGGLRGLERDGLQIDDDGYIKVERG